MIGQKWHSGGDKRIGPGVRFSVVKIHLVCDLISFDSPMNDHKL